MKNSLLPFVSLRRIGSLALSTALVATASGYGSMAIASPHPINANTNKDVLTDLLDNGGPILDAVTSAVQAQVTPAPSSETANTESTSTDSNSTDSTRADSTPSSTTTSTARFTCQYDNGDYVVMYSPESEPGKTYAWAIPGAMGGGWTPERRCNAIAERLENYRPDGLVELRTGIENNYDVVCVTTTNAPGCRIVFTVPNGQDPVVTRDRVFENLAIANSGQDTTAVNTFAGGSASSILTDLGEEFGLNLPGLPSGQPTYPNSRRNQGIDLRPFLDRADGGTGEKL